MFFFPILHYKQVYFLQVIFILRVVELKLYFWTFFFIQVIFIFNLDSFIFIAYYYRYCIVDHVCFPYVYFIIFYHKSVVN